MEQKTVYIAPAEEIICDQTKYSDAPGSFGSRGSIKKNACGAVALYNVSRMLGLPVPFEEVLTKVVRQSRFVRAFGGRLGVWPGVVRRYLESRGLLTTGFLPFQKVNTGYQAYVALYLHGSLLRRTLGAHYVTLRPQQGVYCAYNDIYGSYADFLDMYQKTGARRLWVMGVEGARQGEQPRAGETLERNEEKAWNRN